MSNARRILPLLAIALLLTSACAPGHSIVRGNWPDGRLEAAPRARILAPAPVAARATVETDKEWVAAEADANGLSAADLNRMDVLRTIHFDFDSAMVRADQMTIMESNASWLAEHPGARIIVEGHCDERGTREYNLALGQRRANAAADFLISLGIDPNRIETVSFGEELPAVQGHDERAWATNRRAVFVITATGEY